VGRVSRETIKKILAYTSKLCHIKISTEAGKFAGKRGWRVPADQLRTCVKDIMAKIESEIAKNPDYSGTLDDAKILALLKSAFGFEIKPEWLRK